MAPGPGTEGATVHVHPWGAANVRTPRRPRALAVSLLAATVFCAAGGPAPGPAAGNPSAAPAGGNGGATDVGVTGDTIKLGGFFIESGPVGELGITLLKAVKAVFNDVNATGGIYGRKLALIDCDT